MMRVLAVLGLVTLAACGADGEPETPSRNATVSITPSGVSASTGVAIRKGPATVGVVL